MKRAIVSKLMHLFVALGLAAFVLSVGLGPVNALPPKDKQSEPKEPKDPPPPPPPPVPGAYSGPFNGNTAIALRQRFSAGPKTPWVEIVQTFNMKSKLAEVWGLMQNQLQTGIRDYLSVKANTGRRLYNIRVKVAPATASAALYLNVNPKTKRVILTYTVPGNQIDCDVDVSYLPDPSMRVKFDLTLTMVIETNGTANDPLVLKSATLGFRTKSVNIDGDLIFDIASSIRSFFGGSDFERGVERKFNSTRTVVTDKMAAHIGVVNALLMRPYTAGRGFGIVTPRYEVAAARLVLELSQPALVVQGVMKAR